MRSFLVLAATIGVIAFNWLSATGRLRGSDTAVISAKYQTAVTPAGYAFAIWTLIYLGMLAFSIYQLRPATLVRFRAVRSLYIFSCALNCAWLYFWHLEQITVCFVIILALCATLCAICYTIQDPETILDNWIAKAPFGIYFGWVTAAAMVNLAILLKFLRVELSPSAEITFAVALILFAAGVAIVVRWKLRNYFYPIAIAWALTAIAVRQSGRTLIVTAAAVGVIACLIAALSFVMDQRSSEAA